MYFVLTYILNRICLTLTALTGKYIKRGNITLLCLRKEFFNWHVPVCSNMKMPDRHNSKYNLIGLVRKILKAEFQCQIVEIVYDFSRVYFPLLLKHRGPLTYICVNLFGLRRLRYWLGLCSTFTEYLLTYRQLNVHEHIWMKYALHLRFIH